MKILPVSGFAQTLCDRPVSGFAQCFLAVFLTLAFYTGAEAQQTRFDRANDLLNEQRVDEALEIYRSIKNDGYQSGKLFYNMGLASMYQDSLGLAKYYMLQSSEFSDSRTEAVHALEVINDQFERRSAILPKLPWERFFNWLATTFGAVLLMVFGVVIFNLAAGGIIGSWFTDKASAWLKYAGFSAGVLSLLLILSSLGIQYLEQRYQTAVMTDRQTSVYERPDSHSPSVSSAYEGYVMTVDLNRSKEASGWHYVRLENGMYGWIEKEKVRMF